MPFRVHAVVICWSSVVLSGCGMMPDLGGGSRSAPPPAPLAAAPAGSVSAAPLPPPSVAAAPPEAPSGLASLDRSSPVAASPAAVPAAAPESAPTSAAQVARTDLIGSWTIASAGDSCQLNMVLTTWTGGYRASTRNCNNAALKGISAWNLEGQQIQLFNDTGATVARLFPASKTRFSGQTNGGGPVTVSR